MADLNVLNVADGILKPGHIYELYDYWDTTTYPDDKDRAWFYTVVPDPHQSPVRSLVAWPPSVWFEITRVWSGLWTDPNDPAHSGTLSRCVRVKNVGNFEGAFHLLLSLTN